MARLASAAWIVTLLSTVENIFTIDGVLGHEIVFLYSGRLEPAPPATGATLTESDGSTVPVVWRSLSGEREEVPLYPGSAEFWFVNLAHVS